MLALCMIVGLVPSSAYAATESNTEYLFFATDRHANASVIGNIINNMESHIGENELDYLGLGGDMVGSGSNHPSYNSSTVLGEITAATSSLSAQNVDIVAGIHDMNVNDDAGIVLEYGSDGAQIYEGDNYYVYGVEEYCISEASNSDVWSKQANAFVEWANSDEVNQSKAIFVLSHYPLHAKRNDNDGAYYWHTALNTVATGSKTGTEVVRDIVFFHGHNHTVDSNEYVYNVGDTMSIQNDSSTASESIYYTYATAGYLNENSKATLVAIDNDSITLTKYGTSDGGENMAEVARVANEENSTEVTLESITVTTGPTKTTYEVGEKLDTSGMVVTAAYSDKSTAEVTDYTVSEIDMTTTGEKEVTVTYTEGDVTQTATFNITVSEANSDDTENDEVALPDPTTATVTGATTTEQKTVYVLVSTPTAGNQYIIASSNSAGSAYALKENTTTGTSVTINAATGNITAPYIETSDGTIMWNAASGMTFKSENGGYYLTQLQSGRNRSLAFSTSSSTNWDAGTNTLTCKPGNTTYYLRVNDGSWSINSSSSSVYFYEKQTVTVTTSANGTYSIAGNPSEVSKVVVEGTTATLGSTLTFVPESGTTTTTDTSTTATYTVVDGSDSNGIISGISGNTVTFTGSYGTAIVKVSYTVTVDGTDYTVDNYITVEATAPVYAIDITDDGKSVTDIIAVKGVTSTTTRQLGQNVTYETVDGVQTFTPAEGTIEWESSDESIATVDPNGLVTFKGVTGTVNITVSYKVAEGEYVTDTITISANTASYTTPSDGTNDFPEYPNEGAIRYDKTATAVGNFSQTGIAQVELSMTGVPYTTNNAMDVVVMLDMTGSMSDNGMKAAEEATKAFAKTIVQNEDGSYNSNRVAVYAFNSRSSSPYELVSLQSISSDSELETANTAIDGASDKQASGGTPFDEAAEKCYDVLKSAKNDGIGNSRQQFCVFMSDGGPTAYAADDGDGTYTTVTNSGSGSTAITTYLSGYNSSSSSSWSFTLPSEYYTNLMKADGVTVYTVGLLLQNAPSNPAPYSNMTGSTYDSSTDSLTSIGSHYYFTSSILKQMATDESKYIDIFSVDNAENATAKFTAIASEILEAATNVVVEDKIADTYTLVLGSPNATVTNALPEGQEFYIEVVSYTLDEDHERTSTYTTIEKVYLTDTNKVTTDEDGNITSIEGDNFTYDAATQILTWKADKLTTTELAIRYFVYLDNSAGYVGTNEETEAGTYPTNDYATITYTNYLKNECQQKFPVPQLTWNGAQVSYVFYLVNSNGQPINKSGQVVDFANATFITDVFTESVVWNEDEGVTELNATKKAAELLPSAYSLYDITTEYEIHVYQTENGEDIYNYFVITAGGGTTKVYNTKAGTKYSDPEKYTADDVFEGFDFANTTVAFAVVWEPALVEDTIVVDYGLPVVINVVQNDLMQNTVSGIGLSNEAYESTEMNTGVSTTNKLGTTALTTSSGSTISIENENSIRYTQNDMTFSEEDVFYYESPVEFYEGSNKQEGYMYSKVTVIPATTVYYEDSFVTYKDSTVATTESNLGKWIDDADDSGINSSSAVQATDRPGADQMGSGYDADNIYGYDAAYDNCTQYSLGSAKKVTVDETTGYKGFNPTATFTFHGTGFDLISLTNNDSGMIKVTVKDTDGTIVKTMSVNNYYGYSYQDVSVTNEDGTTTTEKQWVVVSSSDPNALYQVPVIQITDLEAGTYTVTVDVMYMNSADEVGDGQYSFWLDAVRIYDPAEGDTEVEAEYTKDGEINPGYIELRDLLLSAGVLDATTDILAAGVVFIDGIDEATISDYEDYGPNNEVYLSCNQSVAFKMVADKKPSNVQIGAKLANGASAELYLNNAKFQTLNSATDRNYVLDNITWTQTESGYESNVIVLTNKTEGTIISLTNLKAINAEFVTYSGEEEIQTLSLDDETEDTVAQIAVVSTYSMAQEAITLLSTVEEDDSEEVVVFVPESIKASWSSNVKAGKKATLKITTSEDVETISVNGEIIDEYKTNSGNSNKKANKKDNTEKTRVWTYTVTATESGSYDYTIIAYDEDGNASEPITATLTVKDSNGKKSSTR